MSCLLRWYAWLLAFHATPLLITYIFQIAFIGFLPRAEPLFHISPLRASICLLLLKRFQRCRFAFQPLPSPVERYLVTSSRHISPPPLATISWSPPSDAFWCSPFFCYGSLHACLKGSFCCCYACLCYAFTLFYAWFCWYATRHTDRRAIPSACFCALCLRAARMRARYMLCYAFWCAATYTLHILWREMFDAAYALLYSLLTRAAFSTPPPPCCLSFMRCLRMFITWLTPFFFSMRRTTAIFRHERFATPCRWLTDFQYLLFRHTRTWCRFRWYPCLSCAVSVVAAECCFRHAATRWWYLPELIRQSLFAAMPPFQLYAYADYVAVIDIIHLLPPVFADLRLADTTIAWYFIVTLALVAASGW